eukprot:428143_1
MFEAIGLKSPAIENIIGLVSQNENNNNNNENKNKYDVIEEMLNMDTPIHDFENENNINFNIINPNGFNIINESNSVNSNSNSNYISNNELENEFNDEGTIGISSYICTEGADMIDDDCVLPQVMVKYIPNNQNINNINYNQNNNFSECSADDIDTMSDNSNYNTFKKVKNI